MVIEETARYIELDILKDFEKIGFAEICDNELVQFKIYEPYQNKGYGTDALKQIIQQYNIQKVNVMTDNLAAIHLYQKFGFAVTQSIMFEMRKDL